MSRKKGTFGAPLESPQSHPCTRCGACCAYFRVAFYWRETIENPPNNVPQELVEDLDSFRMCMKGTNVKTGVQCVALEGRVGKRVRCTIYDNRPTPCRAFDASYSNGKQNKRCDQARAAHGLKPLKPDDWTQNRQ